MGRAPPNDPVNEIFGRLPPTPGCLHHESSTTGSFGRAASPLHRSRFKGDASFGHSSRVHRAFSSMSVISPTNVHPASQRKPKGAAGSALGFTETRSPAGGQRGTRCMTGWAIWLIDTDDDRRSSDPIPEHLRLLKDPI
jgi:hypothetical protein